MSKLISVTDEIIKDLDFIKGTKSYSEVIKQLIKNDSTVNPMTVLIRHSILEIEKEITFRKPQLPHLRFICEQFFGLITRLIDTNDDKICEETNEKLTKISLPKVSEA